MCGAQWLWKSGLLGQLSCVGKIFPIGRQDQCVAHANRRQAKLRPINVSLAFLALASIMRPIPLEWKGEMSPAAKTYLDTALAIIQKKALKQDTNWERLKRGAYTLAVNAQKPRDTYKAIGFAVEFLGDNHSGFFTADQLKGIDAGVSKSPGFTALDCYVVSLGDGGPASKAGLRVGMHILEVDGKHVETTPDFYTYYWDALGKGDGRMSVTAVDTSGHRSKYTVVPTKTSVNVAPIGHLIDDSYGYLKIEGFEGDEALQKKLATDIQDVIASLDQGHLKGWIVDLRLNGGGNMHPMIAGLGPLLGNGDLGSFLGPNENPKWSYRDGSEIVGKETQVTIKPYLLKNTNLPIAILISPMTASSGEATAISFIGAPHTTVIGTPSAGLTTGNTMETLSDGAAINLCECVEADRTGKKYGGSITPKLIVKDDWSKFGSPKDPVILAAKKWLASNYSGPYR